MFKGRESVLGIFAGPCAHPLQAPLDSDDCRGVGRQVEEVLVRLRVLDYKLGPPMHGEHLGATGLLEVLDVSPCVPVWAPQARRSARDARSSATSAPTARRASRSAFAAAITSAE